ncbi:MAG: membrane or secreted protein [Cytophagales bacterium]|nr:membrane or secreted protein [Cytophagales bacterium]
MIAQVLLILLTFNSVVIEPSNSSKIQGAWQSGEGVAIFSGDYFSYAAFSAEEFGFTYGGSFVTDGDKVMLSFEFHTSKPELVGTTSDAALAVKKNAMHFMNSEFKKIDDGSPGKLAGAWLFSNRIRNGTPGTPRAPENPRKTMKILSGKRFQWIAYNVETGEFMGTGGGTYTTAEGKYIENIDFFSRDHSRVGASLEFDFELQDGDWHHKGLSSKGDPIYEIWRLRE